MGTGEVRIVYQSVNGAHCGVATHHPINSQVVFILGPEHPTADWQYGLNHRQGVVVDTKQPGRYRRLDARDLLPPPTPGALRGGTHVHVWDGNGEWVAFTYNDAVAEPTIRDIGVSIPGHPVHVKPGHDRNHDGEWFSMLVTTTVTQPKPGSDEIKRANEEGWIGTDGYLRSDGQRQKRAIAFQGHVVTANGDTVPEVFVVDLPEQLTEEARKSVGLTSDGRLRAMPGATQRRLTHTTHRRYPGIQGVRHWLRCSPDGSRIACLMKDGAGISQIWTVSPATGELKQLTHNPSDVTTTFSWSPNGRWIAYGMAGQICLTDTSSGQTHPIHSQLQNSNATPAGEIQKESCVISPDGKQIAFVRNTTDTTGSTNQICVIRLDDSITSK